MAANSTADAALRLIQFVGPGGAGIRRQHDGVGAGSPAISRIRARAADSRPRLSVLSGRRKAREIRAICVMPRRTRSSAAAYLRRRAVTSPASNRRHYHLIADHLPRRMRALGLTRSADRQTERFWAAPHQRALGRVEHASISAASGARWKFGGRCAGICQFGRTQPNRSPACSEPVDLFVESRQIAHLLAHRAPRREGAARADRRYPSAGSKRHLRRVIELVRACEQPRFQH